MGRVCYKLNPTPTIKELPAKDKRWVSFYRKKKKKKRCDWINISLQLRLRVCLIGREEIEESKVSR